MTDVANDTSLVDLVAARIDDQVLDLKGGIEFIVDLQALLVEGTLPQRDVSAFVVPLGFDDRGGESISGMHTQILADSIGVILCVKARSDVKGRRALPKIDALVTKVINAVAGWTPVNSVGVFMVKRGRLAPGGKGIVVYEVAFELVDQLRIAT